MDESYSTPIAELSTTAPMPEARRYAYRSFDRHYAIADGRLMSRPCPDLWRAHGERQVYFTSLLSKFLGIGPALTACAMLPDLDHFSGRGAKDTLPLYHTADASEPNILPGLLDQLTKTSRHMDEKSHRRISRRTCTAYWLIRHLLITIPNNWRHASCACR